MDLELRNQTTGSLSTARMKVEVVSLLFAQSAVIMANVCFIPCSFHFKKRGFYYNFFSVISSLGSTLWLCTDRHGFPSVSSSFN